MVRFKVTERKRIQIVDYRGSKELTTSTIEDELKKADAQIKIDTFYDPAKARKVEAIIKEMLAQKGRPFAHGQARGEEHRRVGPAALVRHRRRAQGEGPRDRLRRQPASSPDGKLAGKMKKIKAAGLLRTSAGSGARPPTPRTSGWGARRTRAATAGGSRTSTSTTATSRRGSGSRRSATPTASAAGSRRSRSSSCGSRSR